MLPMLYHAISLLIYLYMHLSFTPLPVSSLRKSSQFCYHLTNGTRKPNKREVKVCRGLEGRNTPSQKLPITPAILRKLRALWTPHLLEYHYIMLWAVCCTCFFGFFRSGELITPSAEAFDPQVHLSIQDLSVDSCTNPSLVQVNLKTSKIDPFSTWV